MLTCNNTRRVALVSRETVKDGVTVKTSSIQRSGKLTFCSVTDGDVICCGTKGLALGDGQDAKQTFRVLATYATTALGERQPGGVMVSDFLPTSLPVSTQRAILSYILGACRSCLYDSGEVLRFSNRINCRCKIS
jgi:hypothetical protein